MLMNSEELPKTTNSKRDKMNRGNDTASKPRGIKEGRKKGTGEKGKEHSRRQILPNSGWRAWAQP